jgi:hypothetical protein
MIIKKKNFNLTPRCGGKWPFTVPEVGSIAIREGNNVVYAVLHEFEVYALSGALESQGFRSLLVSGIWKSEDDHTKTAIPGEIKKSLSPLFEFLTNKISNIEDQVVH